MKLYSAQRSSWLSQRSFTIKNEPHFLSLHEWMQKTKHTDSIKDHLNVYFIILHLIQFDPVQGFSLLSPEENSDEFSKALCWISGVLSTSC